MSIAIASTLASRTASQTSSPIAPSFGESAGNGDSLASVGIIGVSSASSIVKLQSAQGSDFNSLTYADLVRNGQQVGNSVVQAWQSKTGDEISTLIASNIKQFKLTDRLKGLGFAALDKLRATSQHYQQSLAEFSSTSSNTQAIKDVTEISRQKLDDLQNKPGQEFKLELTTVSGKAVNVTIKASHEGLGVDISTDKELSAAEQSAVSQLAKGFDLAIQSISAGATDLDLSSLGKFDSSQISSINLDAHIENEIPDQAWSLKFHADINGRSLAITTTAGQIDLSVDISKPEIVGNASQKDKAIQTFLAQYDKEASRGKGNTAQSALFHAAFVAIHQSYAASATPAPSPTGLQTKSASTWGKESEAVLSGLADFQAQARETSKPSNPARLLEQDHFNFQISQKTTQTGQDSAIRTRKQLLVTSLDAAYHQLPVSASGKQRQLTTDKNSQTYGYVEVNDSSSSQSIVSYANNRLQAVSLEKSVSQQTHIKQYELGKLLSDKLIPSSQEKKFDLLAGLSKVDVSSLGSANIWQTFLDQWNAQVLSGSLDS